MRPEEVIGVIAFFVIALLVSLGVIYREARYWGPGDSSLLRETAFLSVAAGLFWPVIAALYPFYGLFRLAVWAGNKGYEKRTGKAEGLARRERRIRELERELGIDGE